MTKFMMVVKLGPSEVETVKKMAGFWACDPNIETHSGYTAEEIDQMMSNLPYVEPDHQPIVERMCDFFYGMDPEDCNISDRELDNLQVFSG